MKPDDHTHKHLPADTLYKKQLGVNGEVCFIPVSSPRVDLGAELGRHLSISTSYADGVLAMMQQAKSIHCCEGGSFDSIVCCKL